MSFITTHFSSWEKSHLRHIWMG